jgi:hypothetical protein
MNERIEKIFPACRSTLGEKAWERAMALCDGAPERFHEALISLEGIPLYTADLALLEAA